MVKVKWTNMISREADIQRTEENRTGQTFSRDGVQTVLLGHLK
jgi:hypothetical protein